MKIFSFWFTWTFTNNATKYEALYLGLSKAISMGIICLRLYGDFELVINQVQDMISAKHHYLNTYRNRVWDLLEIFLVNFIPFIIKINQIINTLVGKGARLNLVHHKRGSFGVKVLYISIILDTTKF